MDVVLLIAIGLAGGIAVGTQGTIAGAMGKQIGGPASSFLVHFVGAIASLLLVLVAPGGAGLTKWRTLPWYMLGCGVIGVFLYVSLTYTMQRAGPAAAISLLIVGQLLASMVLDHVGAFGSQPRAVDGTRLLAATLLVMGAGLMVWTPKAASVDPEPTAQDIRTR